MLQFFESAAKAESRTPLAEALRAAAEALAQPSGETPPLQPREAARLARLEKFKREQLIVDYLNRGVSIVEIAARIGVGEKRMRAIIREIVARRAPLPPEEFVVIQISRLNEALLNAYSAMSPTNLNAVALVVRIVGQLDRYHGFDAAGWRRRLERARQTKPDEDTAATGGALFCSAELALQDDEMERLDCLLGGGLDVLASGDDCPENLLQDLEKVQSGLADPTDAEPLSCHPRASGGPGAAAATLPGERLNLDARVHGHDISCEGRSDERPENPPQDAEKIESGLADLTGAEPLSCHPRASGGPEAAAATLPGERLNLDARGPRA
jgi:hypothetical protein